MKMLARLMLVLAIVGLASEASARNCFSCCKKEVKVKDCGPDFTCVKARVVEDCAKPVCETNCTKSYSCPAGFEKRSKSMKQTKKYKKVKASSAASAANDIEDTNY